MRRDTIRVANPLSEEAPLLTTTLLPGLLETTARNLGRGRDAVGIFETAPVFLPTRTGSPPRSWGSTAAPTTTSWPGCWRRCRVSRCTLGVVLAGDRQASGWWGPGRAASWADAVQVVRELARVLHVDVEVVQATREPWHPGRCARLLVAGEELGHAGELHPSVCQAYGVPARTSAVEIDLDLLIRHAPAVQQAPTFSTYPVAKEDVALVVDADLPAGPLAATLREGAGELLESVRLFDVYVSDQLGEGRKSLAFALRFRAPDRTLTEAETGAARDAAVALAAKRHGAVQR